jgi:AmiR/NasT family two-component response regulator
MPGAQEWEQLLRDAAGARSGRPQRIAEFCVPMLGVSGAGISMVGGTGTTGVVCSTDEVSARIEDLQVTLGEGPCVDAVASGSPVLVADIEDRVDLLTERWPAFLEAAIDAGVRAVFAFPLRIGAISLGALDLYRKMPGPLDADALSGGLQAADAAANSLLDLVVGDDEGSVAEVGSASAFQAQIHQATGMVMVQLGVPVEQAFVLLRARAFSSERPLLNLAMDVVARRLRFTSED